MTQSCMLLPHVGMKCFSRHRHSASASEFKVSYLSLLLPAGPQGLWQHTYLPCWILDTALPRPAAAPRPTAGLQASSNVASSDPSRLYSVPAGACCRPRKLWQHMGSENASSPAGRRFSRRTLPRAEVSHLQRSALARVAAAAGSATHSSVER